MPSFTVQCRHCHTSFLASSPAVNICSICNYIKNPTNILNHPTPWPSSFKEPTTVTIHLSWDQLTNLGYNLTIDVKNWSYEKPQLSLITTYVKNNVPANMRDYDPISREWFIAENYGTKIKDFIEILVDGESWAKFHFTPKPEQLPTVTIYDSDTDYNTFVTYLTSVNLTPPVKGADFSLARKSYLKATMLLHPDKGGEPDAMSKLNEAWSRLKEPSLNIWKFS